MGVRRVETGAGNPDGKTWEVAPVMRRGQGEEVLNQDLQTEGMGERKRDRQGWALLLTLSPITFLLPPI